MHRNELADRFAHDVDRLLAETGHDDSDRPDPEYREDLVLAAELAASDFSSESTRRATLRRELLSGRSSAQAWTGNPLAVLWRQHPRLATVAATLAVASIVVVAQPDLRASVVQPVIQFLKQVVLGEHTRAAVSEGFSESELNAILDERARQLEAGETWSIETAVSTLGGDVPPGRDPVLLTYCSLSRAEAAAALPFAKPLHLPAGFRFEQAVLTPDDGVVLGYWAPGRQITLYQRPVRPGATTMAMATGPGSTLDEVTVNDAPAAWLNGHKLVWEADGVSYDLEGDGLTLEEALTIARSLD